MLIIYYWRTYVLVHLLILIDACFPKLNNYLPPSYIHHIQIFSSLSVWRVVNYLAFRSWAVMEDIKSASYVDLFDTIRDLLFDCVIYCSVLHLNLRADLDSLSMKLSILLQIKSFRIIYDFACLFSDMHRSN